jgi:hypothetical protein
MKRFVDGGIILDIRKEEVINQFPDLIKEVRPAFVNVGYVHPVNSI